MAEKQNSRQIIHEVVTKNTPFSREPEDDEEELPEGGVVTAWIMVAEWHGTDGNRWLSKVSSDASGDNGLPAWTERGLCNEVVHHWDE